MNTYAFSTCNVFILLHFSIFSQDITPYKFTDEEMDNGGPVYTIPATSRFTINQNFLHSRNIIYYLSKPQNHTFPIAILCGGSSSEDTIKSIIHFHRYFLKEFLDLGLGVLTVEQQGVDGNSIDTKEFMHNYTRSNRLSDYRIVIDHINQNPPHGWNGKLIFLGVSEGGPLVTTLTTDYPHITLATINWSGAGDFSWDTELWNFLQDLSTKLPWHISLRIKIPSWMPFSLQPYFPQSKEEYVKIIHKIIKNPTADLTFFGMTYKYHTDALITYPKPQYDKIKTPYLVVAGEEDSCITSCDAFVKKAKETGAPITYMRIPDMDHYVRRKDEVIKASFEWLKKTLYLHYGNQSDNVIK